MCVGISLDGKMWQVNSGANQYIFSQNGLLFGVLQGKMWRGSSNKVSHLNLAQSGGKGVDLALPLSHALSQLLRRGQGLLLLQLGILSQLVPLRLQRLDLAQVELFPVLGSARSTPDRHHGGRRLLRRANGHRRRRHHFVLQFAVEHEAVVWVVYQADARHARPVDGRQRHGWRFNGRLVVINPEAHL